MKTSRIAMLTMLAVAATTQFATAEMTPAVRPDLRDAQKTLAWRAQNSKGVNREELSAEERKLGRIIDDLEHGRSVDPSEIDRALERANRGSF